MFLKQENSEMDDFERKNTNIHTWKIFNILEKHLEKCQVFNGYPCKIFTIFVHIPSISFYFKKKLANFSGGARGPPPPPPHLAEASFKDSLRIT